MSYPDDVGEEDGLGIPYLSRSFWVPGAYIRSGRRKTAKPKTQDKTRGRAGMIRRFAVGLVGRWRGDAGRFIGFAIRPTGWMPVFRDRLDAGFPSQAGSPSYASRTLCVFLRVLCASAFRFIRFSLARTGWKPAFHDRLEAYPTPPSRCFPVSSTQAFLCPTFLCHSSSVSSSACSAPLRFTSLASR